MLSAASAAGSAVAAILHFGAVDYRAEVWLNGEPVGSHEGGYLPFEFDVINLLHEGKNELLVRVVDPTDDRDRYPDFPFSEIPHGKQSWYGPLGGIWQSVWLEWRPRLHIAELQVSPSVEDASIAVRVALSETPPGDCQVLYTVTGPAEGEVLQRHWMADRLKLESGADRFSRRQTVARVGRAADRLKLESGGGGRPANGMYAAASIPESLLQGVIRLAAPPRLWSPDSPSLYTVMTTLVIDGRAVHSTAKHCGFRTVEARAGRIYLNGEPIYLRGMLDQAYYPETIYTPPSLELLEAQACTAKALGFNCLRTHIKVEDPRYYDVADRLGLLIWTEIPNCALLTDASTSAAGRPSAASSARTATTPRSSPGR